MQSLELSRLQKIHACTKLHGLFLQTKFEVIGLPALSPLPSVPNPELRNGHGTPSSSSGDMEEAVAKVSEAGGINHYIACF